MAYHQQRHNSSLSRERQGFARAGAHSGQQRRSPLEQANWRHSDSPQDLSPGHSATGNSPSPPTALGGERQQPQQQQRQQRSGSRPQQQRGWRFPDRSNEQRQRPSPPDRRQHSNSGERREAPKKVDPAVVVPGVILQLPRMVGGKNAEYESALLRSQKHMNFRAGGHPTIVWDTYVRGDGEKIARCLQMTSFSKDEAHLTCEEKYSSGTNAWRYWLQYVPVAHLGEYTSRCNLPTLELQDGKVMDYRTYAHLDQFFEIEAKELVVFRVPEVRLTQDSLSVLVSKLFGYFDNYASYKAKLTTRLLGPLDVKVDAEQCGRPSNLSDEVKALAAAGGKIEKARLEASGLKPVSGCEWWNGEDDAPWEK